MRISLLNAGQHTDYLYGLVSGLAEIPNLEIEVIDSVTSVGLFDSFHTVTHFNLRGDNLSPQSLFVKAWRISKYYFLLLWYTATTKSKIFHIQWENSISLFDRTLLIFYYKLFDKKLVHTAHNIYKDDRDDRANVYQWISLKIMYHLMDCIIVHTHKMKEELCTIFHVLPDKIAVVPFGINNCIARRGMTQQDARRILGIALPSRVILFFGLIDTYKGVEKLIDAASLLIKEDPSCILVIAGKPKRKLQYGEELISQAKKKIPDKNMLLRLQFIPISEVETYFSAADCVVLPYKKIYQSAVIFLAYRFGLPIIATDIGSFREDIIEGVTGFICKPDDANDMAVKLRTFFESDLFSQRENIRKKIIEYAERKYSWRDIGKQTYEIYTNLVKNR
jgi:D-inositol-3-phosphate glycosyltransferase